MRVDDLRRHQSLFLLFLLLLDEMRWDVGGAVGGDDVVVGGREEQSTLAGQKRRRRSDDMTQRKLGVREDKTERESIKKKDGERE
jgi:hypothetical protein